MTIAAILLAAGSSKRFGVEDKLMSLIDGQPLIRHAMQPIERCELIGERFLIVANCRHADLSDASPAWIVVENPDADEGVATSLRAGLDRCGLSVDGALIALADMPGVTSSLVTSIATRFIEAGRSKITYPCDAGGRQGHPVIWPRALFPNLRALTGDTGGKHVIERYRSSCLAVPVDTDGAFTDLDTVADFGRWRARRDGVRQP